MALKASLFVRILEDVLAVVEEVDVAVDDQGVGLAVEGHPVLEGGGDVVELALDAVLLDIGIERLERAARTMSATQDGAIVSMS